MSRRNFIQRILLQLLVMCFGPRILELVDWEEFGSFCDHVAKDPFDYDLADLAAIYKEHYPEGLSEMINAKHKLFHMFPGRAAKV